jgi:hypothetical protein
VSREMAEKYAAEEGLLFMEASAKTGEGVKEVFERIGTYRRIAAAAIAPIDADSRLRSSVSSAKALPPPPTRAGAGANAAAGARRDGVQLGEGSTDKSACAC